MHFSSPLAYLLTYSTYGSHLHGDVRGSVDNQHNAYQTPHLPADQALQMEMSAVLSEPAYRLDARRRQVVLNALQDACIWKGWILIAGHVRTEHIHLVVQASLPPAQVIGSLKSRATRNLNQLALDPGRTRQWTKGGSKRYLWNEESVRRAVDYVLNRQGKPMAVYDSGLFQG